MRALQMCQVSVIALFLLLPMQEISSCIGQEPGVQAPGVQATGVQGSRVQGPGVSVEDRKKVGSLVLANGKVAGACFYVDQRGYVATCFSNVQNLNDVNVVFNDGGRFRATGVVAASKGKDIAILALGEGSKGARLEAEPLKLQSSHEPAPGDEVITWSGPGANMRATTPLMPKIARRILGEEYIQGLRRFPSKAFGYDPEVVWYWLSQGRDLSCNGAPVFNHEGDQVVGMLSAALEPDKPAYAAIHIQHVSRLIPRNEPKPQSLKSLRDWVDPSPLLDQVESKESVTEKPDSLSGILQFGLSLSDRYRSLQDRVSRAEMEKAEVDRFQATGQSKNLELLAEIEKIQTVLNAIQPEEAYQAQERTTERRSVTRTETIKGPDGKDRDVRVRDTEEVPVTRTVTRYRFSQRQVAATQPQRDRRDTLQVEVQKNKDRFAFDTNLVEPHLKQLREHQADEFFYLADPLGLRPHADHEAFEVSLTATIDEGGAPGDLYIARAMNRCLLSNLDGALQDLAEANDSDAKFRMLVRALEASIANRKGDKAKSTSAMKGILDESKSDPKVLLIAARIDIDNGNFALAIRKLQDAAKLAPFEIEIRHGLAWLNLSAPTPSSKIATESALLAVQMTNGRDWSSVSALAAAHALAKKFELAEDEIKHAIKIPPDTAKEICEWYETQLAETKSIKRDWK